MNIMRTRQFHVCWVSALLMVVLWASDLTAPPAPTAAVIPLPSFSGANARPVATIPAAKAAAAALETCFEREPDDYWAVRHAVFNEYALDGEFATGVVGTPIILALYKPQDGKFWDYAERCNSAAYHQQVKAVKKLRTASLAEDFPGWRHDGPFGDGSPGKHPGGVGPSSFGYAPLGGIFSFGGGGGSGGGKGTPGGGGSGGGGGENPGNQLVGDTGPGGDNGKPDDKDNPGPDTGNPTNPGGHDPQANDPTAVPEPGTLAVFLGLMAGFGVVRRRALNKVLRT